MGPSDFRVDPFAKNTHTAEDAEDAEETKLESSDVVRMGDVEGVH